MSSSWESRAAEKRKAIDESIPVKWRLKTIPSPEEQKDITGPCIQRFLDPKEIEITETDVVGIAEKIAHGIWSAVEVLEAFCHRASLAHQFVNCLLETFFDAARANAKALDDYYAKNNKTIGPLHGVPISLKDQVHVKDVETTMGYVGWIGAFEGHLNDPRHKTFESELTRELRNLGAVLYCKTSVPHTLMCGETVNNITGYTMSPKNRLVTAGGSSGGEGSLIGIRGSPAGFGTDLGGSIRIPCAFNGLYGLRPSAGRIPYQGMANSMDGQGTILSVVGPMATTARALKYVTKAILSQNPWLYDPMVAPIPWRESEEDAISRLISATGKERLCFGVLNGDGVVNLNPPISRAIQTVVEVVRKAGHEAIEWTPPPHKEIVDIVYKSWKYDGGKDIHKNFGISGEPMAPCVKINYGEKAWEEFTASQIAANNIAKREYQKKYMDYWNGTAALTSSGRPVDVVISAVAPFAGSLPNRFKYYDYTVWVNGIDYSSIAVPVTTVDKSRDLYPASYRSISEDDKQIFEDYDAKVWDGAHVGIQLVGRRFTEERILCIAEHIADLLRKEEKPVVH